MIRALVLSLLLFPLLAAPAHAQAADFGGLVVSIYTALGGEVPPGTDLAAGLNSLFLLVLPFLVVLAVLFEVLSSLRLFKNTLLRGFMAVALAVLLIPAKAFGQLVLFLATAGGGAVVLLFFGFFMLAVGRWAKETFRTGGYAGRLSKGSVYALSAVGWGVVFGSSGFYIAGARGAALGFVAGTVTGVALAWVELAPARLEKAAVSVEKKLASRLDKLRAQVTELGERRAKLEEKLNRLLEAGRPSHDPEIQTLEQEIEAVQERIKGVETAMQREQEKAQTQILKSRAAAGATA